ncbi:hypothetical protein Patl1_07966 [Pistacia atlantica]|uniref:Uncharacterized protein n=1 Tax=Pistacia atlantica TaxID=434234 RepID=A0ACC1AJT7_9ROSI|nr:hypothetical protein Patl1_07966 [Pistacia atlantica]
MVGQKTGVIEPAAERCCKSCRYTGNLSLMLEEAFNSGRNQTLIPLTGRFQPMLQSSDENG